MVAEYIYQNKVATQSRGVRLWCGGEYCSRLAIFLDVETLKHFFSVGRLVARTHARYGVVSTSLTVNVPQSISQSITVNPLCKKRKPSNSMGNPRD